VSTARRTARLAAAVACLAVAAIPCRAQASASFKLSETTLNAGGNPIQGSVLSAAHYRIRLDAIGDPIARSGLASGSFRVDAGFVARYPPPGEVSGLSFANRTTLTWEPERSVGRYQLYRGPLAALPGGVYGSCLLGEIGETSAIDAAAPASGQGFFYLTTARNRLREEGTKGQDSSGAERGNTAACP
jgi:hypothetical protein